ncbi:MULTISPECIES: pseudouridine synthase [Chryseobacterium]|uniref:tRNA pseudouridine synthase C n=1 Tax=Chryseobacterium camelliae TaxID=1265445 RepID=A0ABU0TMZ6_9FLAO|nr:MULTISPECIES: pseudouridine synthase [Chryseobacterium]MDT3407720.1 tRNA pseudouridine65 synthase [Pseudacidovorax intermedius]MDQ1098428.1 tRNA pseudouridine65 synthase [Chryseobacterium camelliae]MDQ1102352.1 tRNA pseudouridine65 synthase [Chryseobacterium sp. SORGH_AS_1048]MDR6085789.1 tRNA pseudouridine65 synthase [Chryseobacterium sp. SORGH_AS_0909]MDR6130152.1 tRNA pseudouridine65 synthase [Chryseobacterium sp. SORGH_AS_1175]
MLEILYRDEHIIAINKPSGLLVHKSFYSGEADTYAIQELKKQIGQKVYPVHRLDRKTSGVLLFTLDKETLRTMSDQFATREVEKKYIAILRGWTKEEETIDYDLTNENEVKQNAMTYYRRLQTSEIDLPFLKHLTSRYSLVEAIPETGRFHQLRKHFKHILHPILGCRKHGCNKQNKLLLQTFNMTRMTLHAYQLAFTHPITNERINVYATIDEEFKKVGDILGFDLTAYVQDH